MTYRTRSAKALRLYCPISAATLGRLLSGDQLAIEDDPALARMLAIIRSGTPLGDFGDYRSVVELAPGWELFTPGDAARPTLGEAGASQTSATAILTLYAPGDAAEAELSAAIAALIEAHAWEVPVIEIADCRLLVRAGD